jgi:hypothetical protein
VPVICRKQGSQGMGALDSITVHRWVTGYFGGSTRGEMSGCVMGEEACLMRSLRGLVGLFNCSLSLRLGVVDSGHSYVVVSCIFF